MRKQGDSHQFLCQRATVTEDQRPRSLAREVVTVPLLPAKATSAKKAPRYRFGCGLRYAAAALALLVLASPASAQDAEQFFKNNCAACHTIGGGRLTAPDLKDVTTRRDRAWLREFIPAPIKKVEAGDPYVLGLQKQFFGIVMPSLPGLTPALVDGLIDYIEKQSGGGAQAAEPAEPQPPVREPVSQADVEAGRAIFTGRRGLASGAPACISCHTVNDLGGLGGGKLAPDLTLVAQRLGGQRGLTAWLSAPATPTMATVFGKRPLAPAEIKPLVAYFDETAHTFADPDDTGPGNFAMLGVGFAFVGLVVMNTTWRKRFRGVRRALVKGTVTNWDRQ